MRVALASRYRTLMLVLFPVTLGLGTAVLWLRSLNLPLSRNGYYPSAPSPRCMGFDPENRPLAQLSGWPSVSDPHPPCRRHLQNSGASPGRWTGGCEDHHRNVRTACVPKSSRERTVGSQQYHRRPAGDGAKAPTNTGFTSSWGAVSEHILLRRSNLRLPAVEPPHCR